MSGAVLMGWGPHRFTIGSMAYEELRQTAQGRWAKHEIIGRRPVGQYLGPGEEPVVLRGAVYPLAMMGGEDAQVQAIMADCSSGQVYTLLSINGDIQGPYRLEHAEKTGSYPDPAGNSQKIEYELHFLPHDDGNGQIFAAWP